MFKFLTGMENINSGHAVFNMNLYNLIIRSQNIVVKLLIKKLNKELCVGGDCLIKEK